MMTSPEALIFYFDFVCWSILIKPSGNIQSNDIKAAVGGVGKTELKG